MNDIVVLVLLSIHIIWTQHALANGKMEIGSFSNWLRWCGWTMGSCFDVRYFSLMCWMSFWTAWNNHSEKFVTVLFHRKKSIPGTCDQLICIILEWSPKADKQSNVWNKSYKSFRVVVKIKIRGLVCEFSGKIEISTQTNRFGGNFCISRLTIKLVLLGIQQRRLEPIVTTICISSDVLTFFFIHTPSKAFSDAFNSWTILFKAQMIKQIPTICTNKLKIVTKIDIMGIILSSPNGKHNLFGITLYNMIWTRVNITAKLRGIQ